jgi:hypothetical protein
LSIEGLKIDDRWIADCGLLIGWRLLIDCRLLIGSAIIGGLTIVDGLAIVARRLVIASSGIMCRHDQATIQSSFRLRQFLFNNPHSAIQRSSILNPSINNQRSSIFNPHSSINKCQSLSAIIRIQSNGR